MERIDLDKLSAAVGAWADHNFKDRTALEIAAKACEEVGELVGATIKEKQGIRSHENQPAAARDAVGDVVIALANYCSFRGWSFDEIVREVWKSVERRDWKRDPERQHLKHP